jgi:hypothetical protein
MFISVDEDATLFDDSCITCKTPDTQERPRELDLILIFIIYIIFYNFNKFIICSVNITFCAQVSHILILMYTFKNIVIPLLQPTQFPH